MTYAERMAAIERADDARRLAKMIEDCRRLGIKPPSTEQPNEGVFGSNRKHHKRTKIMQPDTRNQRVTRIEDKPQKHNYRRAGVAAPAPDSEAIERLAAGDVNSTVLVTWGDGSQEVMAKGAFTRKARARGRKAAQAVENPRDYKRAISARHFSGSQADYD